MVIERIKRHVASKSLDKKLIKRMSEELDARNPDRETRFDRTGRAQGRTLARVDSAMALLHSGTQRRGKIARIAEQQKGNLKK